MSWCRCFSPIVGWMDEGLCVVSSEDGRRVLVVCRCWKRQDAVEERQREMLREWKE